MSIAPSGYRERNSTAERTLVILRMFSDEKLSISASDVAAELSVARSTAYRYLQSLAAEQFIEESPSGGFRLGIRILKLARLARRSYGLSESALPMMNALCERFGEAVVLTRRSAGSVVCVERILPQGQLLQISYERGSILPINAGASAVVLIAWLEEAQLLPLLEKEPLQRFTENTVTDTATLAATLQAVRQQGFCVTRAHVNPDTMGIAVPIFGVDGEVVAGLSIVTLERRVDQTRERELVQALMEAADELGTQLVLAG